ncbi:MAG: YraN family protein [Elusimicrobia bacterium]|nr:YraN family protein [Elusimicrobiota bacterium]
MRDIGRIAEHRAARWLEDKGHLILARNWRSVFGEIDIIMKDGDCLVLVEVRYRARADYGTPGETVNWWKQRRIIKTALIYMLDLGWEGPVRFDVLAMGPEGIEHIKDAFQPGQRLPFR